MPQQLIDLGPVKKKDKLIDLGPAPTPIMEAIQEVEPAPGPPGLGIPQIADPQDVTPTAIAPTQPITAQPVVKKPKVVRSRWDEFVDATGRGIARVGAAGAQAAAAIRGMPQPPGTWAPSEPPEITKRRKKSAAKLRKGGEFLWKLSQNPGIAAQNKDLASKALNLIGETIPYITATTAAYVTTGPVGGFAVGSLVEGNSAYRTALDAKVPESKAKNIGIGVGIISGAVEAFGGRYAEQLALKAAAKLKSKIVKAGAVFGIGTVVEALEEGAQEVAQITGEETYRDVDWNERATRVLSSMAGGGFLGGTMRGGSMAARGVISAAEKKAPTPFEQRSTEIMTDAKADLEQIREVGGIQALPKFKARIDEGMKKLDGLFAEFGMEVPENIKKKMNELVKFAQVTEAPTVKGPTFRLPKQDPITPKPDKSAQFKDMSIQELRTLIDTTEDPELQRLAHLEVRSRPAKTPPTVPIAEPEPTPAVRKPAEAVEIPPKEAEVKPEKPELTLSATTGDIVIDPKSDLGVGKRTRVGSLSKVETFGRRRLGVPAADKVGTFFKRFALTVPEFTTEPVFTIDEEGFMVYQDGGKFRFKPELFGIEQKLESGQKIKLDLESYGIKVAKGKKLEKAQEFVRKTKGLKSPQEEQVDSFVEAAKKAGEEVELFKNTKGGILVTTRDKYGLSRTVVDKKGEIKSLGSGTVDKKVWQKLPEPVKPEAKPKPGAKEAGFVDLTPIAEAGEQVSKKAQKAHKVLTRFTGLESNIRQSLIKLEEESRRIPRQTAKESIQKYGKLSAFESRAILNHLDNPKKYPDLPEKLKTYVEQVQTEQQEVKAIMNELGYGANWPEGRIAHLREKLSQAKSKSKQIEIMEAIDELEGLGYVHHTYKDISAPRRIIRAMTPKRRISKRPSGLLGRKYPTLDIAEKAGKKVSHLAVAQADMLSIARRAKQNNLLIDAINKNTELALPEKKAPDDWVYLDNRAFPSSQKTVPYTDAAGKAQVRTTRYKYHPAIAEAIEELAYVSKKHPFTRAYDKVNATLKHILFYNPVVMSKNDLFQAWRATGTGFLWNLPKAAYNVAAQTPQYHEYRKAGLYNNVISFTPAAKHLAENMLEAIRKSKGRRVAEHLSQYINPYNIARDFKWLNDKTTWKMDEVLRTATAQSMTRPRSRWKKMGMTNFEATELANDFLANYGKVPKRTRQVLNRAIFTPTYKVSMARVLGKMWASPKKFWPQLARHYAYKMFVWYVLPGIVGLWVYGDWKAGRSEKGYKIVLKHPRTGRETVYSLSDPLLEEAKVSQRPILQTLEYNLAAVPNLILNLLRKPYYRNQRDKYGHLFKLGTPIMKDVYNMTDKDKTTAERILTQLAIAYVYHRKGKPQDNETAIVAAAKAMSIWTDWKMQKEDIERRMGAKKETGKRATRMKREKRMLRK